MDIFDSWMITMYSHFSSTWVLNDIIIHTRNTAEIDDDNVTKYDTDEYKAS